MTGDDDCMTCGGDGWEFCETTHTAEGCWEPDCDGIGHTHVRVVQTPYDWKELDSEGPVLP